MNKSIAYDGSEVILDDIPEVTDFSKARKNPFADKLKKGYVIVVEHKDYDEVITIQKARRTKTGEMLE
jgi:hypothetical protein